MSARILVVDDYADARELLSVILEYAGFEVRLAATGAEAVDLARAQPFDVVVMDIFMPGMDGVEATRRIKAEPGLAALPVIAYTARPSPLERIDDLFSAICVKPCPPDRLLTTVRDVLGNG